MTVADDSMRTREDWIYESIADPDCTGWACPTCNYTCNYHAYGLVECERCGYQLDADRVRDALAERENSAPQIKGG
jgi:ssDNA-binding Zn-finger/Zn-ribbon topoisomerase 1